MTQTHATPGLDQAPGLTGETLAGDGLSAPPDEFCPCGLAVPAETCDHGEVPKSCGEVGHNDTCACHLPRAFDLVATGR